MSFDQVATLLSWQFALYGAGWLALGATLRSDRGAVAAWGGFMAGLGGAFALAALRDDTSRTWLAFVASDVLFIASMLLLQIGLDRFTGNRLRDRVSLTIAIASVLVVVLAGPSEPHASLRIVVAFGANALLGVRIVVRAARPIASEFGRWMAAGGITLAAVLVGTSTRRVIIQLTHWGRPNELNTGSNATALLIAYLVTAAFFNFGFMALLVLRLVGRLRRQSLEDPLTGLPNRRSLATHLEEALQHLREHHRPFAVLVTDVDHFKQINDAHGHAAGDAVLAQLGPRLRASLRETDFVARTGGEEFVVVAPDTNACDAAKLAERVRRGITGSPFDVDDGALVITVSVGVAVASDDTGDPAAAVRCADAAMYVAKQSGRDRVVLDQAVQLAIGFDGDCSPPPAGSVRPSTGHIPTQDRSPRRHEPTTPHTDSGTDTRHPASRASGRPPGSCTSTHDGDPRGCEPTGPRADTRHQGPAAIL